VTDDQAAGDAAGARHEDSSPPGLGALALEALRWNWDDAYRIGWDDDRGWHARRRDGLGGDILGTGPDELGAAIREDYSVRRVPRDLDAVLP
jgi:hypothetical protein